MVSNARYVLQDCQQSEGRQDKGMKCLRGFARNTCIDACNALRESKGEAFADDLSLQGFTTMLLGRFDLTPPAFANRSMDVTKEPWRSDPTPLPSLHQEYVAVHFISSANKWMGPVQEVCSFAPSLPRDVSHFCHLARLVSSNQASKRALRLGLQTNRLS